MAYRFTNTEKWSDSWFSGLKQIEMLLFIYLCDNCDVAGFAEVNLKRWAVDLNSNISTIEGALKGLQRGIVVSSDGECLYLKNFLKHQKNIPLNPNNRVCTGILKRFELYKNKFNIQDINEFIESPIKGASKGHQCPTGNGNGIIEEKGGKGGKEETENEKAKSFSRFNEWIDKTIPYLRQIKNQISFDEYCRLTEKYNGEQMRKVLADLSNYKDAPKKYVSVNLTFQNWAKKEYGNG